MQQLRQKWIKGYLNDLYMEVINTGYSKVSERWKHSNIIPPFSCLYFIMEGSGWIKIKGIDYFPQPGQLLILPAGIVHSYSSSAANPFCKYWCHFNAKVGDLHIFHLLDLPFCIDVSRRDDFEQLFKTLHHAFHSQDVFALLKVKSVMFDLILNILDSLGPDQLRLSSAPSLKKLNELLTYIENHLSEELTIEQLANLTNYNPKYFIRYFKSMMSMTPIRYIHKARMDKAKRLLMTTDWNMIQIAAEIGMDRIYFSKLFKHYTSLTPGQFRKLNKWSG